MAWGQIIYFTPLISSSAISVGLALYAWRRHSSIGKKEFSLLMLSVAWWAFFYALEMQSSSLGNKLLLAKIQYLGIASVPLMWSLFSLRYTGRGTYLTKPKIGLLAIIPLTTVSLALTNDYHGLLWSNVYLAQTGNLAYLAKTYGFWFWINAGYSYILMIIGSFLLLYHSNKLPVLYHEQVTCLLIAAFMPMIGNFLYITRISPMPNIDSTPFSFTLAGLALAWGIFRYRILDIVPVARDKVFEKTNDLIYLLDRQLRVVDLNPAAESLLNESRGGFIGKRLNQVMDFPIDMSDHIDGEHGFKDPLCIQIDDQMRFFDLTVSRLKDNQGRFVGLILFLKDITERKMVENNLRRTTKKLDENVRQRTLELVHTNRAMRQENEERKKAQRKLKLSQEKLRTTLDASPDSIIVIDIDGRIIDCNPATADIFEYSSIEDVIGKEAFSFVSKEDLDRVQFDRRTCLNSGFIRNHQYKLITSHGREFPAEVSASVVKDSTGSPSLYVVMSRDISERKRNEKELRRYSERLEDLVQEKSEELRDAERMAAIGQTASMVGHDLRNPLQAILNNVYLARKQLTGETNGESLKGRLEIIRDEILYMNKIVSDLQDFAKPLKPELSPINVKSLIQNILTGLNLPKKVDVSIDLKDTLTLEMDSMMMKRVLTNLVNNAIQAMPDGGKLKISADGGNGIAHISVSDTGTGISPDDKEKVFKPLFTTKAKGQGFGLAVCERFVTAHQGRITIDTELRVGTTFTIHIPAHPNHKTQEESPVAT